MAHVGVVAEQAFPDVTLFDVAFVLVPLFSSIALVLFLLNAVKKEGKTAFTLTNAWLVMSGIIHMWIEGNMVFYRTSGPMVPMVSERPFIFLVYFRSIHHMFRVCIIDGSLRCCGLEVRPVPRVHGDAHHGAGYSSYGSDHGSGGWATLHPRSFSGRAWLHLAASRPLDRLHHADLRPRLVHLGAYLWRRHGEPLP